MSKIKSDNDESFHESSKKIKMLRVMNSSSHEMTDDGIRHNKDDDTRDNQETLNICKTKKSDSLSFSITNILQACKQSSNNNNSKVLNGQQRKRFDDFNHMRIKIFILRESSLYLYDQRKTEKIQLKPKLNQTHYLN